MFKKVELTLSVIFNSYNISVNPRIYLVDQTIKFYILQVSYKHSVALQDEEIFVPFNMSGVYFADRVLDMSDEFLSNDSVTADGSALFIKDLGTERVGEVF